MNKTEAEGAPAVRVPLTEAELDELTQLGEGGEATALEWRAAALAAHPFLLAEVRDLRRLAEMVSKRHHDHDERGVCFWCGKPWPCVDYADVLALSPRSSRGGEGNAP